MLTYTLFVFGFAILIKGADYLIKGGSALGLRLRISGLIIGLTVVAFGTSLPELATSVVAAYRKNPDLAVGNIVGSNIFNVFFVLAISAIIRPSAIR